MDLFLGLIDKETQLRYVLRVHTTDIGNATVEEASSGHYADKCDWGPTATRSGLLGLAHILLNQVNADSYELRQAYASRLTKLTSGKMWVISKDSLVDWVDLDKEEWKVKTH